MHAALLNVSDGNMSVSKISLKKRSQLVMAQSDGLDAVVFE